MVSSVEPLDRQSLVLFSYIKNHLGHHQGGKKRNYNPSAQGYGESFDGTGSEQKQGEGRNQGGDMGIDDSE